MQGVQWVIKYSGSRLRHIWAFSPAAPLKSCVTLAVHLPAAQIPHLEPGCGRTTHSLCPLGGLKEVAIWKSLCMASAAYSRCSINAHSCYHCSCVIEITCFTSQFKIYLPSIRNSFQVSLPYSENSRTLCYSREVCAPLWQTGWYAWFILVHIKECARLWHVPREQEQRLLM